MKTFLFDTLLFFQWGCIFLSSIFSLKLMGKRKITDDMNKFYWYPVIGGISVLLLILQKIFNILTSYELAIINIVLLLFHFIFLSRFIYEVLSKKTNAKYVKQLFFFFLLVILFCVFTSDLSLPQSSAYAFANLGLVIFCCFYYWQLFEETPKSNLLKEPSFWIITGVFFCMCSTIPLSSLRVYLSNNIPHELYLSMGSIGNFSYGVMHLFFIKGFLCQQMTKA